MHSLDQKKASQLLQEIQAKLKEEPITIGDFVSLLGDRSFALAILIFSLPNSLPVPGIPGFSTLTGIPILWIALQMVWGKQSIWLPETVARREIAQHMVGKIITTSVPYITRLEKWLHPRFAFFCTAWGERLVGLLITSMAFILTLPIVGGNFLPGFSISLLALALLERDGLFAIISAAYCILSLVFMYQVLLWAATGLMAWIGV
ncbi:MAG: exopolysaccharide biosynthesis protein [Rickettsiales bacterium]|nr:exopolysaccharide biosynthesis protein [Rickettsiales bacterium]